MILQASWFVDLVPQNVALILIFSGLIIGVFFVSLGMFSDEVRISEAIGGILLSIGSVIGTYNFYLEYEFLFVAGIIVFSRYIEGLAAIRLYQKLAHIIRNRNKNYQSSISISKKLVAHLVILFILIIVVMTAVFLSIIGQIQISLGKFLELIWVSATICYTIFGLSIKFKLVTDTSDMKFGGLLIPTLILVILGAELYNFGNIGNEIYIFILGALAYSFGYWYSAYEFVTDVA